MTRIACSTVLVGLYVVRRMLLNVTSSTALQDFQMYVPLNQINIQGMYAYQLRAVLPCSRYHTSRGLLWGFGRLIARVDLWQFTEVLQNSCFLRHLVYLPADWQEQFCLKYRSIATLPWRWDEYYGSTYENILLLQHMILRRSEQHRTLRLH